MRIFSEYEKNSYGGHRLNKKTSHGGTGNTEGRKARSFAEDKYCEIIYRKKVEKLFGGKILLRDMLETDIDDYIRWNTIETEWLLWDAPWEEDEEFNREEYRQKMLVRLSKLKNTNNARIGFEICVLDEKETHVGWVNSYFIDDNYNYSQEKKLTAIGIDIPEQWARGCGYGTEAWALFINYLRGNGIIDIYTQTWSGNNRVLGLIKNWF